MVADDFGCIVIGDSLAKPEHLGKRGDDIETHNCQEGSDEKPEKDGSHRGAEIAEMLQNHHGDVEEKNHGEGKEQTFQELVFVVFADEEV